MLLYDLWSANELIIHITHVKHDLRRLLFINGGVSIGYPLPTLYSHELEKLWAVQLINSQLVALNFMKLINDSIENFLNKSFTDVNFKSVKSKHTKNKNSLLFL